MHCVEYAAVYGLEAVADVGEGAAEQHGHGVGHVGLGGLLVELHLHDPLPDGQPVLVLAVAAAGAGHGAPGAGGRGGGGAEETERGRGAAGGGGGAAA